MKKRKVTAEQEGILEPSADGSFDTKDVAAPSNISATGAFSATRVLPHSAAEKGGQRQRINVLTLLCLYA